MSLSIMFSSFFSLSVLKHFKLFFFFFENYDECKTKHLFLIKKSVTRFDKKQKKHGGKRALMKRNITADCKEEDSICEDSKKIL